MGDRDATTAVAHQQPAYLKRAVQHDTCYCGHHVHTVCRLGGGLDIKTGTYHIEEYVGRIPITNKAPELDLALRAAVRAGGAVLNMYRMGFEAPVEKSDGSPVTKADLESHRILVNSLAGTGHAILSEEDTAASMERLDADAVWIIDPLDGTSHFVNGTGEFTIMVALVRRRIPVLGVIFWPSQSTMFVAQRGSGAFRHTLEGWQQITVTKTSMLSECRAVGSKHHLTDTERQFINSLGMASFVSIGSSLKVGMISAGEAEVYVTMTDKMKEWDTAASHCIISEAGGRMTDMYGGDLTYNNRDVYHRHGILATNGEHIHRQILQRFADSGSCATTT